MIGILKYCCINFENKRAISVFEAKNDTSIIGKSSNDLSLDCSLENNLKKRLMLGFNT